MSQKARRFQLGVVRSTASSRDRVRRARAPAAIQNAQLARANAVIMAQAQLGKKGMDTVLTSTPIISTTSTNGDCTVLNLVRAGNGSWERTGRKIVIKSLRIKGRFIFTRTPTFATGAAVSNHVRMVVVWDKSPNGAAIPTFDTVFGTTDQAGTEACLDALAPPRYDNFDRFRVIMDRVFAEGDKDYDVVSFGTAPSVVGTYPIDEYIKPKVGETVFSGQSTPMTITDISTGALYVYFRANSNVAGSTVGFNGIARLRYAN